jgi:Uma2 family endonuclease
MAEAKDIVEAFNREPPKEKMTFEEFLAWCDEDTWAEWVGGEVQMVSPASKHHQDLGRFLMMVLTGYVRKHGLGEVIPAPFTMRLLNVPSGREPDLLFVTAEHLDRLRETYLDGAADLVVEIVSPSSIGRDRGDKFVEYEEGGVREYWLIYPDRKVAEFYNLAQDGHYRMVPVGADGIYLSQVVEGFWIKVDWLWQEPLPLELDVLRELKVISG